MATKVTDNFFEYGTVKYFRGKAENIQIGCFGDKRDPIGNKAWLDVEGPVKAEYLTGRVRFVTTTEVDWASSSKSAVEVNGLLRIFGVGVSTAFTGDYGDAVRGHLKLAKFVIDEGPLKKMLNEDATAARKYLADEGSDGRIVSEVWVVMEAELAEHFTTSSGFSIGVSAAGVAAIDVTANGGKHGTQTISMTKGTSFAYLLHKVTDWNEDKTVVLDLGADYKGLY